MVYYKGEKFNTELIIQFEFKQTVRVQKYLKNKTKSMSYGISDKKNKSFVTLLKFKKNTNS